VIAQPGGTGGEFPVSACAPPGSLPPGGSVYYAWAPDPEPSQTAAGVGQGCVLSVLDAQGQPVTQFDAPVKIVLPFDLANLSNIDPKTLVIYWKEPGGDWLPLETVLDFENEVAIAETDRSGKCSLMGQPTAYIFPPKTTIQVSGDQSPEGTFYDEVQVSISSTDASDVSEIYYSLDNGTTWVLYTEPFTPSPVRSPSRSLWTRNFSAVHPAHSLSWLLPSTLRAMSKTRPQCIILQSTHPRILTSQWLP
jgi:hypothetical protein